MPKRTLALSREHFSRLTPLALRFWPDEAHAVDPRHCVDIDWDTVERERVAAYVADCYETAYLVPSPVIWCAFGCAAPSPHGAMELTDGTWLFPEILLHYLQQHAVKPPSDFLTHIRRNGYRVPDLAQDDDASEDEPWWNRPWTRRQTVLAYFLVGWCGAITIMAIGDYQLQNRLPTVSEIVMYVLLGLVLAPLVAVAGAVMSRGERRRLRGE